MPFRTPLSTEPIRADALLRSLTSLVRLVEASSAWPIFQTDSMT